MEFAGASAEQMSESFLVVIPADPFAPLPKNANQVQTLLADFADTDEARTKDCGKLQFIDCGENFESIHCPVCNVMIDIPQWHEWMDEDWDKEDGFLLSDHTTLCCAKTITLDAPIYRSAQGFARWFISARAGNRGGLSGDEIARLEAVATIPLRAITQQY